MKISLHKALLALSLAALTSTSYAASSTQTVAGCGLGSTIFKDQTGLVYNVFAGTTNFFALGSVSMTFGLLNCPKDVSIKGKVASFIDYNRQQLAMEVAQGRGERLEALVEMYGVSDQQAAISALKANHTEIFSQTSTADIAAQMEKALKLNFS
ncbi:MAG: DUF3015 family protein [Gallionella sp.]